MSQIVQEEELMSRFRQGEGRAFKHVFELYHPLLYYYAYKRFPDEQPAEDIVAECFVKLWERRENFENLRALKAFLYITARNMAVDHWRQKQRTTGILKQLSQQQEEEPWEDERARIEAEVIRELHAEISSIPEKAGEVLRLYYFEKMTTREIAARLGLAEQTVLNHKAYAIKSLRTVILRKDLLFVVLACKVLWKAGIKLF